MKNKKKQLLILLERAAILERAAMNIYQFNTSVVRSTSGEFRVMVGASWDDNWGDCVGLRVMFESDPGKWMNASFSPARARIIAKHLVDAAARLEADDPGMGCIDKLEDDPTGGDGNLLKIT